MNWFMYNKLFIFFLSVLLVFALLVCDKNPSDNRKDNAPALPPAESMKLDLSFFSGSPINLLLAKITQSKQNFVAAGLRVLIIKTTVLLASIAPTAVFVAALNQPPILEEDAKFHWRYSTPAAGNTYRVDLAGWIDVATTEAVWEVYVSSTSHDPPLDHFLWYTGRSKINNRQGWWIFNHDQHPDTSINVLKIDWEITADTHRQLFFSNIYQSHSDFGDSLKYTLDNFDNYLVFYDSSTVQTSTIYWDSQNRNGFIQWFDYKDGAKSCWDENQDDIECPPPY